MAKIDDDLANLAQDDQPDRDKIADVLYEGLQGAYGLDADDRQAIKLLVDDFFDDKYDKPDIEHTNDGIKVIFKSGIIESLAESIQDETIRTDDPKDVDNQRD